jgi:hypothetical protein
MAAASVRSPDEFGLRRHQTDDTRCDTLYRVANYFGLVDTSDKMDANADSITSLWRRPVLEEVLNLARSHS